MTQPTPFDVHANEYSQELHYYLFAVNLDMCVGGTCNTFDGLSNKLCAPNKTKDLNLHVFNKTEGINKSRTLTKHISCKCEFKFDNVTQIIIAGMSVKKVVFEILQQVTAKMESMQEVLLVIQ